MGPLVANNGRQEKTSLAAAGCLPHRGGAIFRRGARELGKHRYRIDGQSFEVEVHARTATDAEVSVNGRRYRVERADDVTEIPTPHAGPSGIRARRMAPAVAGELRAPMAGLVLRVNVAQGQSVAAGDPVLVLDAMKMENTIRAPHGGTVHEVVVVGGQSVLTGALLARIDES
jgi:biotin carboxyl carrier protein